MTFKLELDTEEATEKINQIKASIEDVSNLMKAMSEKVEPKKPTDLRKEILIMTLEALQLELESKKFLSPERVAALVEVIRTLDRISPVLQP